MKIQVSDLSETQKKVVVEIPAEKVQPEIDKRYRSVAKKAHIKGFRPGKAPVSLIKAMYGGIIQEEVAQKLIDETFLEVLESQKLKPIAQSDVEEYHYAEDGSLVYTISVYVAPEFEVSGYKGIEVKIPKREKSIDELLEARLENIRKENVDFIPTDESLSEGMLAVCDVRRIDTQEGSKEGEDLTEVEFEVGSGEFNLDAERQMIGMKPGEKWVLEVSFGERAPVSGWANQTVKLEIHLKEASKEKLPELNDEFAKQLGYSSLEELKQELLSKIEKEEEERRKQLIEAQIVRKLLESHNFPVPEKAVQQLIEEKISNITKQLQQYGVRVPHYLLRSEESRERIRPEAEVELKYDLILDKIAEKESITLSEEDEQEIIDVITKVTGESIEDLRENLDQNPFIKVLRQRKLRYKVADWLIENATVIETSKEEVTSQDKPEVEQTTETSQDS